jgi:hypothetical protein
MNEDTNLVTAEAFRNSFHDRMVFRNPYSFASFVLYNASNFYTRIDFECSDTSYGYKALGKVPTMQTRMKQAGVHLHNKIGKDSTWGYKALLQKEFLISCVPVSAVKAPALPYFMSTNFAAFLFLWFVVVSFTVLLPHNFQRS